MDEEELAKIIKECRETITQMMDWLEQSNYNDCVQRWWLENDNFFTGLVVLSAEDIRGGDFHKEMANVLKMAFTFGCYLGWNESR